MERRTGGLRTGMNATCSMRKPYGLDNARAVHRP